MSKIVVEPLLGPYELGEGPHWDHVSQKLYYVDIFAQKIFRLDPATGALTSVFVENGPVGFAIPVEGGAGQLIAGSSTDLVLVSWDGEKNLAKHVAEKLVSVDDAKAEIRWNDAKVDASGRLWGGTMGYEKDGVFPPNVGSFYSFGTDLVLKKQVSPVTISNGLAWNSDNDTFYYIDSLTYQVAAYNCNSKTGEISNRRVVFDLRENNVPGLPDGMTIDSNGNLWVAVFGGGGVSTQTQITQVLQINPDTGKLLRFVKIDNAKNITSVAFGGPNLDILYVTSATTGLNESQLKEQSNAGYLFAVKGLGVRGVPANSFKLARRLT